MSSYFYAITKPVKIAERVSLADERNVFQPLLATSDAIASMLNCALNTIILTVLL
jgi:hypothetical protein